jgi:predicted hydrocarbon binding protein
MVHIISHLARAGFILKSQKQQANSKGGNLIQVVGESTTAKTQADLIDELSQVESCELIRLVIDENQSKAAATTKPRQKPVAAAPNQERLLQEIGKNYPNVSSQIKAFSESLPEDTRNDQLKQVGNRVGSGIYKRDYSLGSPLKLAATIQRELAPALSEICTTEAHGSSLVINNCPFCADQHHAIAACDFVTGFISGFLEANSAVGTLRVEEVQCGSGVNNICTFSIFE